MRTQERTHRLTTSMMRLALLAAAMLASPGCGKESRAIRLPAVTLPAGSHDPTGSQLPQVPSSTQDALFGVYDGKLTTQGVQQSFQLTLRPATVAGNPTSFGYAQFSSTGGGRTIQFEVPLNLVFRDYPSSGSYGFVSVARVVSGLSQSYVSVQLILKLNAANQFDPTQSWFYIKDCGFSQALDCSNVIEDPRDLTLLGKR
jgi:hypothetical protein